MAVAAIAALSSCSDKDILEDDTPRNEPEKQSLVFTATMEGVPGTRATFDNTTKCASWECNDQININGHVFLAKSAGTSSTFSELLEREVRPTFVSSESKGFSENEAPKMLVDEEGMGTKWCANTTHRNNNENPTWDIIVKTATPVKLYAIKLWNGNDTGNNSGRCWKTVKVSGSASSSDSWTEINTFNNLNLAANDGGFAGTIDVNATAAYQYYKLEVLEVASGNIMQMSDMKFTYVDESQGLKTNDAPFTAYFPATLYDGMTDVLPAQITEDWADGKFNMPMYANSSTTDLQFKNLCGVVKITVKSTQIAAVKSIRVSSANKAVSGAFTVDANNAAVLTDASIVANILTVTYTNAVATTAEGNVFYVAIPAQIYQELKIELDPDGKGFTKSMTTKNATNITVERNKIYPIVFTENHEYVDLDLNVKWATCNIGASAPEDYGYFFAWGETEGFGHNTNDRKGFEWAGYTLCDGTSDHLTKYCQEAWRGPVDGKTTLDPEDDAAHVYWGGTWRMPTQAEQDELRTNCTWTWCTQNGVNGYKVTSNKNGNSIFLPAAGTRHYNYLSNEGTTGVYWSSSLSSSLSAHNLFLNENHVESNGNPRCNGYSVRAVCP